jgi:hypothetical protein
MAVKKHFPKAAWFTIWLVLGLLVGMTQLFAPLHEIAHATVANNNGVEGEVTGWAEMNMVPLDRPALLAGYVTEVFLLSVFSVISALIGISPKRRWITGGFWVGAAFLHWIRAFDSTDFIDRLKEYFQGQFPNDAKKAASYYEVYRAGLIHEWRVLGVWVFIIVGSIIMVCMLVGKKAG